MIAFRGKGHGLQRRNRHHAFVEREGETLSHAAPDADPGEGTRAGAKGDAVEVRGRPVRRGQHRRHHGQQAFGVRLPDVLVLDEPRALAPRSDAAPFGRRIEGKNAHRVILLDAGVDEAGDLGVRRVQRVQFHPPS